ncbi:MAG: hypothetical protein U0270_23340 [Labilithrix sp.]
MKTFSLAALALIAVAAFGCANNAGEGDDMATAAGEVNATAPITIGNWLTHPKIVAVRDIVNAIDASEYASESKTELCQDSGHGESERTKLTDENGVIRELVLSSGSEDSAQIESHYYDANGKLRFIFTTRNDVHGNSNELRTYFDETGARIWDVRRHAFSATFNPDLEHAKYEPVATEDRSEIDPAVFTPAVRYDAPKQCD